MAIRSLDRTKADRNSVSENDASNSPRADFRWLIQFVLSHKWETSAAFGFSIAAGIATALQPYMIGIIIDHVEAGVDIDQLLVDGAMLIGLGIVTVIAFFGLRYYSGQVAFQVTYDIQTTLFGKMLKREQDFFNHFATGDIISRMHSDVQLAWRMLAITLSRGGDSIFTLLMAFFLLGTINISLTVTVFIVLSISTAFQIRAGKVLAPIFEKVQDQAGTVSALVQDSFSGIQTIKTSGRETGVAEKFREENYEYRRRWLFFKRRNEPVGLLPNMISEFTSATVVFVGGYMTIQGVMTIGNFAQFLIYLNIVSQSLLHLGMIYQRYQQTRGALERLTPLLQDSKIDNHPNAEKLVKPRGEIEFHNVSVNVDNTWLLRDISLRIPAGSVVAIVGPTGCGKTMLVNLIARVLDPTEGAVTVDGVDVRKIKLEDLRDATTYVPQSTFLFSQELHKNVRMGDTSLGEDALERAIHISRMSNDLPQLPDGIDTMVGERGVMLSGGQKQRVAIARAIIRNPAILVLDDALSSVDTHTAADILADLRGVLRSRTSIIIAHRIATVKDADFIVVMDDGRIVEQGTHDDLLAANGAYTQMVEREFNEMVEA